MAVTRFPARSQIGQATQSLVQMLMASDKSDLQRAKEDQFARQIRGRDEAGENLFTALGGHGDSPGTAALAASMFDAGANPSQIGDIVRTAVANRYGANDPRTTNAMLGAGGAMSSTPQGFNIDQGNQMTRFREGEVNQATRARDATAAAQAGALARQQAEPIEIMTPEGPRFSTKGAAPGQVPLAPESNVKGGYLSQNWGNVGSLPPAEQRILGATGAAQSTPRNYRAPDGRNHITYDGRTDANTGGPLPPGGFIANATGPAESVGLRPNVQGNLQSSAIANEKFKGLVGLARRDLTSDRVGIPGIVKGLAQDATQVANGLAKGLGYSQANDAIADMRARAADQGVDPGLINNMFSFDPQLAKLDAVYGMLVYSGAEALAGQEGRSLSNADVVKFQNILGSPRDWLANVDSLNARLDAALDMIGSNQAVVDRALGRGAVPAAPTPQATPAAPAAPTAPAAPAQPERWERGPDGRPRRVQ